MTVLYVYIFMVYLSSVLLLLLFFIPGLSMSSPRTTPKQEVWCALMVLQVSSEVLWHVTGTRAPLSVIDRLTDSSVLLPPALIVSSTHVRLVPRFWHLRLFDHSACLYCTAENYRRLQREEERKRRKGEDGEKTFELFVFLSVASCLVGVKLFEGNLSA